MTKNEYEELQQVLSELTKVLEGGGLSEEERFNLQLQQARVAGMLASIWLPISNVRKAIMFAFILLAIRSFMNYNDMFYVYMLLAAMFSPRIVSTSAYYFGRLMGGFK